MQWPAALVSLSKVEYLTRVWCSTDVNHLNLCVVEAMTNGPRPLVNNLLKAGVSRA